VSSRVVLALDQGTSGTTALVVDSDGRVIARGYAELPQYYPQPGWVEHDPEEIWATVGQAATAALAESRVRAADVAAVGIANQRETTIVWDRTTGAPIHRAIVWQCRRTAPFCERLRADGLESLVRERTGLVLDAYFSGTKIRWLLDEVPGARKRAEAGELAFGTVDTWLLWKLTGGVAHATDVTNASRTLCLDLRTGDWDDEMLGMLGVPRRLLPVVRSSAGVFGETRGLEFAPITFEIADDLAYWAVDVPGKASARAEALTGALEGVEVIFHQAAAVGVGQSMYEAASYTRVNSLGTAMLMEKVARPGSRVEKVIVASSMSIYGEGRYRCTDCGPVAPPPRGRSRPTARGTSRWSSRPPGGARPRRCAPFPGRTGRRRSRASSPERTSARVRGSEARYSSQVESAHSSSTRLMRRWASGPPLSSSPTRSSTLASSWARGTT